MKATVCSVCQRAVYEDHVDAQGRCAFCVPPGEVKVEVVVGDTVVRGTIDLDKKESDR